MVYAQETMTGEIIVDNFAGGGGASTGIEIATGRLVALAVNHDPAAILMHRTNHPYTEHFQASVWDIDPKAVCPPVASALVRANLPEWCGVTITTMAQLMDCVAV